ncbi:MAG: glycosyltransferase family 1 protein [Gammaproteobacteria bacterium]|nr:glycosyltransferase family 1 protein [Gammaproteobacteria bacterium]
MLITIVTETYAPDINGVAMTLGNLISGLSNLGHQVQLICPDNKERDLSQLPKNVSYHPVRGLPIPGYREAKFGLPSKSLLNKLWRSHIPDVIYIATEGPLGWQASKIANKLGIATLSGFHTNFHSYSNHYGIGLLEKVVSRYLVALHNKTGATLTPTLGQKKIIEKMGIKNVSVLGRGVDTQLFSPEKRNIQLRNSWGITNNEDPVILYVGRIAAEKNISQAIRTYNAMHKINYRIKFVLVGDGPLFNKLKQENPDFIFAGMQSGEKLAQYYASSDIFIFPSMTETFGNVILEAMASGLGVIAYNYAAANTHIKHNENGQVARFDDAQNFTENACRYLNNALLLKKLRMNASRYASGQSWAEIVRQLESLLMNQSIKNLLHTDLENNAAHSSNY